MLKIFNTLSRKKEIFKSVKERGARSKKEIGLYTCGPTVYNYAHIGNLRTYVFEDILRRTLESVRYKVKHVMNITDIDDKIIHGAQKEGKNIFEFTKIYEKTFFEDLNKLNIKKAWKYPKATVHIKEMIQLVKELLDKKLAYVAENGVYFDISRFKKYGKLSGISKLGQNIGMMKSRILTDEYSKANVQDFALWKFKKDGEPSWKAPFGEGRPGWHLECSAMSMKYLGKSFDIHAGGVDLIFPHHENEIAQSEGATGKKFAKYFLEGEHLLVAGEKMSKSKGNVFTLRDIEKRKVSPLAFRYFVLGAHYRSKLNFTWDALWASQRAFLRLYEVVRIIKKQGSRDKGQGKAYRNVEILKYRKMFKSALFDDLNTPKALAVLWNFIKNCSKFTYTDALKLLYEFDEVLGLGFKEVKLSNIPQIILNLVQKREECRREKKWKEADEIREKLKQKGFIIEDTSKGPKLSPTSPLI